MSNAKLSENVKLLKEREKRRSIGARPKVLESMDSNKVEASRSKEKVPETNKRQDGAASRDKNLSYADQLSRGISGLVSVSLLKELRSSQMQNREKDSSSDKG